MRGRGWAIGITLWGLGQLAHAAGGPVVMVPAVQTSRPPAAEPPPPFVRGKRLLIGVMSVGAAGLDDGIAMVIGYHARFDLVLPKRLWFGSELALFATDDKEHDRQHAFGSLGLDEELGYDPGPVRLSVGFGPALVARGHGFEGWRPAAMVGIERAVACLGAGGPCYWLQARVDRTGGVNVVGLSLKLGL